MVSAFVMNLMQFITLSIYLFFVGFTFCDGFKLHIARKVVWFAVFLVNAVSVFAVTNEFSLPFILPIPTTLAFLLCLYEKKIGQTMRV